MKKLLKSVIVFSFLTATAELLHADGMHPQGIKLDGTAGSAGKLALPGPDYEIKAKFGKQSGANLFHSFEQFNVHKGESATFSGPDSVQNILSRVSGGSASWIDGKLGLTVPDANLYFLNPAGVMFGPNASLDLTGSFHVSTADYLRMGENDRFYARPQEKEILSVARPAAFGFLNPPFAKGGISVEGKGQISADQWDGKPSGLAVSEGKTLSLVGGDIEIRNGTWFETAETGEMGYANPHAEKMTGSLSAPGGRINMVSAASAGEMAVESGMPDFSSGNPAYGTITVSGKSLTDVSGNGAGSVFIRAGKFVADDSAVYGKNFGAKDSGRIEIQADSISFENGSEINANTYGSGKGGDVILNAFESLTFSGADEMKCASRIFLETHSRSPDAGNTGRLDISAGDIVFSDGAYISGSTFGSGSGGNMMLLSENDIRFGGMGYDPYVNYFVRIYSDDNPVNPEASYGGILSLAHVFSTGGNSGDIDIKADNIFLSDSASILSMTAGAGNAGSISISADDSVMMARPMGPAEWGGAISVNTRGGNAGNILLEAGELTVKDGYSISSSGCWEGECGKSGDVNIRVSRDVLLSGVNPYGGATVWLGVNGGGNEGGNIFLEANALTLENGAAVTAVTYGSAGGGNIQIRAADSVHIRGSAPMKDYHFSPDTGYDYSQYTIAEALSSILAGSQNPDSSSGSSGTVSVHAQNISISDSGMISTSTSGGGRAGIITLEADRLELGSRALISSASTSPENGGAAGIIDINADSVRLTADSRITTDAVSTGNGGSTDGRISITAADMLYLNGSEITTSVKGGDGKGGDIEIIRPEFAVLSHSRIEANAYEGAGGNIQIAAGQFLLSADSSVEASSQLGIDGNINIESPDADVSGSLTALPSDPPDAARWLSTPCFQRTSEDISRFVITRKDGVPPRFDDWLPGQLPGISYPLSLGSEQLPVTKIQEFLNKGQWAEIIGILESSPGADNATVLIKETLRSQMYAAMGYYRKAAAILNAALPVAEKSDDPALKALYYNCIGDISLCMGNVKEAITCLKKALEEARKADKPLIAAGVLNNLGNLRAVNKDLSGALKAYQEALALISQSENSESLGAKILINTAHAELVSGKYENAPVTAENAAEQIGKQTDGFDKAANLISLALPAQKICDLPGSECRENLLSPENLLGQAAQIGEKTGNLRIVSCAYGYLGEFHEARKEYSSALKMTRKAVFAAQQGDFPEILYRWQWLAARLLRHEEDTEHAIASCQSAADTLNPVRSALSAGSRTRESGFDTEIKPVYLELVQLLLEHADKPGTSDMPALLHRAGDAMEQMKKAEIQDFYKDDCLAAEPDRKQAPDYIPPGTAVMYPIALPGNLILMILFPDDIKQIRVLADSGQIGRTARNFRKKLEAGKQDFQEHAMQLYDWLIRPAEKELDSRNTDTLILVPDGPLCLIPFSALHSGESFLTEKYALGTIPALNITDTRHTRKRGRQILLTGVSEARQDFLPLPNVKNELRAIKAVMKGRILLDQDFTLKNFEAEMQNQDYGMVHMATHAVFGNGPEDTFLLTYDERLTLDRLEHLVHLKKYQEKPLELLTLSACETAADNERAAFGIAGAALKSGAESVLATLWKVDDKAASLLIAQFYQNIGTGEMTKAQALRNAQKKLIRDRKFEHPEFWAPFLLIGNWM